MRIKRAFLDELELPLVEPFETSFGRTTRRRILFVTLEERSGETGLGECVADVEPLYSSETVGTARETIERWLLPSLASGPLPRPQTLTQRFARWRGHSMAKAAVEMALWDLTGRIEHRSVADLLGGGRRRVEVGVSVGIQRNVATLVQRVGRYLEEGYRRVKIKVRPGWDEKPVGALRRAFPDLRLWVDANQAYSPTATARILRWATRFTVEQVEQPFPDRSIGAHAALRARAPFRVCLDESVPDRPALEDALARGALSSLNLKPGRVGGAAVAVELARRAARSRVPSWLGGMLESGVGRALSVAVAARPEFTLPADLSASRRYFRSDLIEPPFALGPGSTLTVPRGPGLGVEVDERLWQRVRRSHRVVPL